MNFIKQKSFTQILMYLSCIIIGVSKIKFSEKNKKKYYLRFKIFNL